MQEVSTTVDEARVQNQVRSCKRSVLQCSRWGKCSESVRVMRKEVLVAKSDHARGQYYSRWGKSSESGRVMRKELARSDHAGGQYYSRWGKSSESGQVMRQELDRSDQARGQYYSRWGKRSETGQVMRQEFSSCSGHDTRVQHQVRPRDKSSTRSSGLETSAHIYFTKILYAVPVYMR
jgi:predicted DNA-binding WGR domain protein